MNLISWIKRRVFRLDDASARYQQALASANKHDLPAALAGYTAVIDMVNTPPDLRAMALYNPLRRLYCDRVRRAGHR